MPSISYPKDQPFDAITGELLPAYRDAYLHNTLLPVVALKIEVYLRSNPVQTGLLLGRYHKLAQEAREQGRHFTPPAWVQQQLLFQPSVSKLGPLRRPIVRVAVGLFAGLSLASAVQWARNEPLVPAPVVAAVTRVAASASQATERLVRHFSVPSPVASHPKAKPEGSLSLVRVRPAKAPAAAKPAARPAPLAADTLASTAGTGAGAVATNDSLATASSAAIVSPATATPVVAPAPAARTAMGVVVPPCW
jgi:hypothetical protein